MSVTVAINSVALIPQPASTDWRQISVDGKLDGTDALGAAWELTLKAPVFRGGTCNWDDYDNSVLTSVTAPAPGDTMRGTAVTYSSGVVSKPLSEQSAPPGGLVRGVTMVLTVVI